jgi:SAM-dependent methyltransferase
MTHHMRLVRIRYGEWKAALVRKYTAGLCLDLGCRNRLYERDFGGEYVGVDIRKGKPPPDIICDAGHLPFRPGTFKTVVALDVIEHFERPQECLFEVFRVLSRDGLFLATTPNAASPSSWWDFTHRQHFTLEALEPLTHGVFEECQIVGTGYPTLKFGWLRSLASKLGYVDSFIIIGRKHQVEAVGGSTEDTTPLGREDGFGGLHMREPL